MPEKKEKVTEGPILRIHISAVIYGEKWQTNIYSTYVQ
jgi:hypothetical protein